VSVPERGWYQIVAGGYGHVPADDPSRRETLIDRFAQATAPAAGSEAPPDIR
jgi:hypothetical protein